MDLVLLRHGESEWNRKNLFTGWEDVGLTDRGREEARESGRLLKAGGYDFDICYTSFLKRAVDTLNFVLEEMDREWLPVVKSWRLNERHYGALQGLNKAETAAKYGEEQVKIWRRSFSEHPPFLEESDKRNPRTQVQYRDVAEKGELPLGESLSDAIERVLPYYHVVVEAEMRLGRRVLIVSHGNALRALVKYLDGISDDGIAGVEIPTGVPLVYHLDDGLCATGKEYLGDGADVEKRMGKARSIK